MTGRKEALHVSQVKARFYDTDLSSFVFFTNYQKWFDSIALIEFLHERGLDWKELHHQGVDMTLASITFEYKAPLTVDDVADITIEEVKLGNKSVQLTGSVYKHGTDIVVAGGKAVYVFVDIKSHQTISIPDDMRRKLS